MKKLIIYGLACSILGLASGVIYNRVVDRPPTQEQLHAAFQQKWNTAKLANYHAQVAERDKKLAAGFDPNVLWGLQVSIWMDAPTAEKEKEKVRLDEYQAAMTNRIISNAIK